MRPFVSFFSFLLLSLFIGLSLLSGGCAQIGMPTGGVKDTLAPKLVKATPAYGSRNVTGNKVTLEFDEYIDVQDLQQNLIISPLQKRNPTVISNPRSITIKFRDSLLPNTTYTINFGDAVRDINESNIYKDLSYTFSTGASLDSMTVSGKVFIAETGGTDSTLIVMLYRNRDLTDSSVQKRKPDYIAKVAGDGSFEFTHLPADSFSVYALKDGDGGKTYNSKSELFAFDNAKISSSAGDPITLYAYAQEKATDNRIQVTPKPGPPKKLSVVSTNLLPDQDLLQPLEINFNNPLKETDSTKIYLIDTLFKKITAIHFSTDSTAKKITLSAKWQPANYLVLIIEKDAVKDSAGNILAKNDTIRFKTKKTEDYGKLILRFNNLDLSEKPVLQFLSGDIIRFSYPLASKEWVNNMFPPGEYGVRILYDTDRNGKWTTGNYSQKLQPEKAVTLPEKISVRADWDNEREINL